MDQKIKKNNGEEPLTPMGRLCLLPEHNHVVYCVIGLKTPINVDTLKDYILNSIMIKIQRFTSLLVLDPHDGTEHWKKTQVNLDNHIFIHDEDHDHDHDDEPLMSEDDIINSFLADMAISSPMSLDKPLWELHIIHDYKCLILRVHHAVADGMSLMSLLWTMGTSRRVHDDGNDVVMSNMDGHAHGHGHGHAHGHGHGHAHAKSRSLKKRGLWECLVFLWYSLVFGLKLLGRCLWVKDKGKVICGIEGVEFWPRKIATARFALDDMKKIKKVIPNATVHDVLYGILWCGLTRYINARYPQAFQEGAQITGMCPVNLREQPGLQDVYAMLRDQSGRSTWGNIFSVILLPIHYNKQELDPLTYVAKARAMMAKKKQSNEARFSYNLVSVTSKLLGSKVAGIFYYNLFRNTSFIISNMVGPQEEISIAGSPVAFIRATSSAQPQAITMHMVSYAGKADLQIQVAKDVIPDPKFLAKCFQDALLDMKDAAERVAN